MEELERVDFRVRMGGDTSTEGELAHKSQITERWNEEIWGTGGRGLKTSLS